MNIPIYFSLSFPLLNIDGWGHQLGDEKPRRGYSMSSEKGVLNPKIHTLTDQNILQNICCKEILLQRTHFHNNHYQHLQTLPHVIQLLYIHNTFVKKNIWKTLSNDQHGNARAHKQSITYGKKFTIIHLVLSNPVLQTQTFIE